MSEYCNYIAIIGRIPEEAIDDTCFLYEHMTRAQALQTFIEDMYEDAGVGAKRRKKIEQAYGCAVIIEFVLTSESPIALEQSFC